MIGLCGVAQGQRGAGTRVACFLLFVYCAPLLALGLQSFLCRVCCAQKICRGHGRLCQATQGLLLMT